MKPTILVAATSPWFPAARLSMSLANAGANVEAVCPRHHPLHATKAARATYTYYGLAPLMSLKRAIIAAKPDLIVPADDLSTRHLHHLYQKEQNRGQSGKQICALIERSFGSPESFAIVYERATFMRIAQEEGVLAPKSGAVMNLHDLRKWASEMGFPIVLKSDGTSGGEGVKIAETLAEAESAFHALQAPPLVPRAAKRALVDRDRTLVWPSLLGRKHSVTAQTFISGFEATSTVACWKGKVLAGLHFEIIKKKYATGPATVMRLIENAEMSGAVETMVRRLKLSGLHGFDFMIETAAGRPYLVEINPRTTQVGHLTLGPGRDLPAALCAAVSDCALQPSPKLTEKDVITLFPQEWMRDPASPFLQSGYHDVPWEEPELMRVCVRHAQTQAASKANRLVPVNLRTTEAAVPADGVTSMTTRKQA